METKGREILMARLIGLLLTDGSLSQIKKTKVWRISFSSNSSELTKEFSNLIFQLFEIKTKQRTYKGAFEIKHTLKRKFAEELMTYSPSYRTLAYNKQEARYPETIIPNFIVENDTLAKEFLKYAFTGDGTIIFNIGKARYGFRFDRCVKLYS